MNKFFFIGLSIAITAFLATNAILMFGEKSVLTKDVYVSEYERTYSNTYTEKLPKEAVTAPLGATRIFVQDSEAIEQWVVNEGDFVQAGTELALLNEAESVEQRAIWEAERTALQMEYSEVQSALSSLESARATQGSPSTENTADRDIITNEEGDTVELDVNVSIGVEVPQDGTYAAGIAQAQQQLAEIDSKMAVVDAQLNQSMANPALISPIEGVVATIDQDSEPMSIEIYSNEKLFVTYVLEDEWQDVQAEDRVFVHADGMEQAAPGTVMSVAQLPAEETQWLEAYRALDPVDQNNPIAIYEVRIITDEPIAGNMPFGSSANASIITNEAADAVAIHDPWLFDRKDGSGSVFTLTDEGRSAKAPVTISFDLDGKAILSEGVSPGTVVMKDNSLRNFNSSPNVFMPFPSEQPDLEFAKNTYWRNYVEYLLAR